MVDEQNLQSAKKNTGPPTLESSLFHIHFVNSLHEISDFNTLHLYYFTPHVYPMEIHCKLLPILGVATNASCKPGKT